MAMKVVVTGSGGLIGGALVPSLTALGHEVVRLVRRAPRTRDEARWDPERGEVDRAALSGADAAVNLCGANIAGGRWTAARKALLRSSRIGPTRLLAESLAGLAPRPKVLVSASGVNYYGSRGSGWVTENTPPGDDFLARLSLDWEQATTPASEAGIRVACLRNGVVLSPSGGALGKMLLPFKAGVGGVVGPGTQYMSWICLDDMLGVVRHALDHAGIEGGVNAVAPEPVTNAVFTRTLGRVLHRPTIFPVPSAALRLVFGEMADATLLSSVRARPERLLATGYRFLYPDLEGALRHVLGRAA
jgi:uncharacterized protein (TIGR01777 family)